jgi:hypothetical protein
MRLIRHCRSIRICVTVLYAIGVSALGLTHNTSSIASENYRISSAYALPDGSTPSICAGAKVDGTEKSVVKICDACLLTSSPGLLPVSASTIFELYSAPIQKSVYASHSNRIDRFGYVAHLRGPPLVLGSIVPAVHGCFLVTGVVNVYVTSKADCGNLNESGETYLGLLRVFAGLYTHGTSLARWHAKLCSTKHCH